jgi:hypothetical protein
MCSTAFKDSVHPKKMSDIYSFIRPPRRLLVLDKEESLFRDLFGFFFCVAHSLPLGVVSRDFTYSEDETRRYFS